MTKETPVAIEKNMIIIFGVILIALMLFGVAGMLKVSNPNDKVIS